MNGKIYKISNIVNDKIYIGLTTKLVVERFAEHIKNAEQGFDYHIYRAMRKHGIENFYVETIEEDIKTKDELCKKEIYYIGLYDSFKNGYNSTLGGEGNLRYDWSDTDIDEIRKLYVEEKKNTVEIGKMYKCSDTTINKLLKNNNVKIRKGGGGNFKITNQEDIDEIIRLYTEDKKSTVEIGKIYNCSDDTINKLLRNNNIKIRTHSEVKIKITNQEDIDEIIRLYTEDKKSTYEIGKIYEVSDTTISRLLKKNNVKIRGR